MTKNSTYQLIRRSLNKLASLGDGVFNRNTSSLTTGATDQTGQGMHLIALEDRVLYDAAPFDMDAVAVGDTCPFDSGPGTQEPIDWSEAVTGTFNQGEQEPLADSSVSQDIESTLDDMQQLVESANTDPEPVTELIVIDASVEDFQQLLDDLATTGNANILIVQPNQNGFQAIGDRLEELGQVSAIHIISHGENGALTLGNATLSLDNIDSFSDELVDWGMNLTDQADLLFYGCDLASQSEGQILLEQIAELTDADVAASTDLTGHESLQGDWELEFQLGMIEAEIVIGQAAQEMWTHVLPTAGADSIFFSTSGDFLNATSDPGAVDFQRGDLLEFGGPDFALGSDTDGQVSQFFQLENFADTNLDAIHRVAETITIGTDTQFTLVEGDILFSTAADVNLPGISELVEDRDIVVFRPTAADNSDGVFIVLFDYSSAATDSEFLEYSDLESLTIVEQGTQFGDTVLEAGQILFSAVGQDADERIVYLLDPVDVGLGNSSGTTTVLIDGDDLDINNDIDGIELIERDTQIGGQDVAGGSLLLSVSGTDTVANNNLTVSSQDIFALEVTQTSLDGSAEGTAQIFFDASDVSGQLFGSVNVDAISVSTEVDTTNNAPEITNQSFGIDENASNGTEVGQVSATDSDTGDVLSFEIIGGTGIGIFEIDSDTGIVSVVDSAQLDFETNTAFTLFVSAVDLAGSSATAEITINLNDVIENSISGTIFRDENGNGNVLDDSTDAFQNAEVLLYQDSNGNNTLDDGDTLVQSTQTDANGAYQFDGVGSGDFFVVVDSRTLDAESYNGSFGIDDVFAEQTYGSAGSLIFDGTTHSTTNASGVLFGGRTATGSDDLSSLSTAEHVTAVALGSSNVENIDFGFSFNVVTNLEGGDIADIDGRTVQGSLRQFIINANSIVGGNQLRFVPVVDPNQIDTDTWRIELLETLPEITDDATVINGQAYSVADGITLIDGAPGTIGISGTTVGTNDIALSVIDRPELELVDAGGLANGLVVSGNDVVVDGIRIEGFGDSGDIETGNIVVDGGSGFTLSNSHVVSAESSGVVILNGADDGTIRGNLIENSGGFGVALLGDNGNIRDVSITENFILGNGQQDDVRDGIGARDNSSATISRNLISGNQASGIDTFDNNGPGLVISENTISNNGQAGVDIAGIRLFGSNHTVSQNRIIDNQGDGVLVVAGGAFNLTASQGNEITQNEFGGNGGIAIDLGVSADSQDEIRNGDDISNFLSEDPGAGNRGIPSPIIESANFVSGSTEITGIAGANQRIEIYRAAADAGDTDGVNDFGEGVEYLGFATSDSSGNFSFTSTELATDDSVTAIAVDSSSNTSEFGANVEINSAPTGAPFDIRAQAGTNVVLDTGLFGFADGDGDTLASVRFTTTPTVGQLINLNGMTALVDGDVVSAADIAAGNLIYRAPDDTSGTTVGSIEFRLSDGVLESDTITSSIEVVNDVPVISTNSIQIDENSSSFFIEATDSDSTDLTFSLQGGDDSDRFGINPTTGEVTFLLQPDFEAPSDSNLDNRYEIQVEVSDPGGNTDSRLIIVEVLDTNDNSPVITSSNSFQFDENQSVFTTITTSDEDLSSNIQFSIDTGTQDGGLFQINQNTGLLELVPVPDFENPQDSDGDNVYVVRVLVSDGDNVVMQDISFEILPLNDNLHSIVTDQNQIVTEGQLDVVQIETTDNDTPSETITFSIVDDTADAALFSIDPVTGELSFTTAPDFENPLDENGDNIYQVRVAAEDVDGNTVTRLIEITVQDTSEPITGIETPTDVDENTPGGELVGLIIPIDPDISETYTFTLLDDAGGLFVVDSSTGELRLSDTAVLDFETATEHAVQVQVSDTVGNIFQQAVTISVNNVNEAPEAVDLVFGTGSVAEGGTFIIDSSNFSSIIDPDGDVLEFTVTNQAELSRTASVKFNDVGDLVFSHTGAEIFTSTVVYQVSDGNGGTDTGTITITIDPVNDAPTAIGEQFLQTSEGSLTITARELLGNDFDPDSTNLTVVIVEGPASGDLVETSPGIFVFTPASNTPAIESFSYVVSDGQATSNVVQAELLIPFPFIENEETEIETEDAETRDELQIEDVIPVQNDDEAEDSSTESPPSVGPVVSGVPAGFNANNDNDVSDQGDSDATGSLFSQNLLSTNYGFTTQRSSVDLSQLLLDSETSVRGSGEFNPFGTIQLAGSLWGDVNPVNEEFLNDVNLATESIVAAAGVTGLATAVYIVWMARGGMLLASVVSSMPAWQSFDPLPILQYSATNFDSDVEDESIESMLSEV